MKKSAWATPTGIDHDYNFLKSVERSVDRAGQDLAERGVGRRHNKGSISDKRVARAQAPGSALHTYLEKHDVRVERAPVGMSRQKANRTRNTNRGKVMWTVEWIDGDGETIVNHDNEAGRPVSELWKETMSIKRNAESSVKRDRKRKRQPNSDPQTKPDPEEATQGNGGPVKLERFLDASDPDELRDAKPPPSMLAEDVKQDIISDEAKVDMHDTGHTRSQEEEHIDAKPPDLTTKTPIKIETSQYFYLLKPLTASKAKVVIPLDLASTLTECLAHRTVLEYPTIFVLADPPDALPEGVMLNDAYKIQEKAEHREVHGLLQEAQRSGADMGMVAGQDEKPLDAGSILDMLQRDVGL